MCIFDATHSVPWPGPPLAASPNSSNLASAAVATGAVDGLFVEVHEEPSRALSDGANALRLDKLGALLGRLRAMRAAIQERAEDGTA